MTSVVDPRIEDLLRAGDGESLHELGKAAFDDGREDEGLALLRVAATFGDAAAFADLGAALERSDAPSDAVIAAYEGALALECDVRVALAVELSHRDGDVPRVATLLQEAVADGEPGALHQLGLLRLRRGELDEAIALLERAVAEDDDPDVLDSLARAMGRAGRTDEAAGLFERAADGGHEEAVLARVFLLEDAGRWAEAEALYRAAVDADVEDAAVCFATALSGRGRRGDAVEVLRAAVERGDAGAMMDLGNLLAEDEATLPEALLLYRRSVAAGHADAATNLATHLRDEQGSADVGWALLNLAAAEGDEVADGVLVDGLGRRAVVRADDPSPGPPRGAPVAPAADGPSR
jgi:tetratricopeptide (TPR) repeat protein